MSAGYYEPPWFTVFFEMPVLTLRFSSDAVWRDCCDAPHMRRRWGPERARRVSRRLQQLEAMASLADLEFMPFDVGEGQGGVVEVAVDEGLALSVQPENDHPQEDGHMGITIWVTAVGARSEGVVR